MTWYPAILVIIALILLWLTQRGQKRMGLPRGRVVSTDMGKWQKNNQVLFDPHQKLAGRPDYLVEHNNTLIPIEVKTGHTPSQPYDSHILQLAAYCHLVAVSTGKTPPYGFLNYPERTFKIDFNSELQQTLLLTMGSMRNYQHQNQGVPRSHHQANRCVNCGYREICDQRL